MPERDGRTGRVPVSLLLVLLLVLGSFAQLVIALVTDEARWAWGSVATSVVAGVLLATDWVIRPKIATVEPGGPAVPAGSPTSTVEPSDTSQTADCDTPEAPSVERTDTPIRRTGTPESGISSPSPGRPVEPD